MSSGKLFWELRLIIDPESGQATNTRSDIIIDLTCDETSHSSSGIPLIDLTCEMDCDEASTSTSSGIPLIDLTCDEPSHSSSGIPLQVGKCCVLRIGVNNIQMT